MSTKKNTKQSQIFTGKRFLITSGPTRQYLDPVRYLTNASSGRMGAALAAAAVEAGHEVVVVSGPVDVDYPDAAQLIEIVSTEEMLEAARSLDFEKAAFLRDQLKELKELPELVLVNSKRKKRDFLATKKQKRYKKKAT